MNNRGQSIIEAVVMIGVLALVLTGAVVLSLNSISSRTNGFDRKKSVELGEVVVEDLVESKNNTPDEFWKLEPKTGLINPVFDGYVYSISYLPVASCGNCTEAVVSVVWVRNVGLSTVSTRLFSHL